MTRFGAFTDGVGIFHGHIMYDADHKAMFMTRSDIGGIVHPEMSITFVPLNFFVAVTSAAFIDTHVWHPTSIYHNVIRVALLVGSDAATVGQVRLEEESTGL